MRYEGIFSFEIRIIREFCILNFETDFAVGLDLEGENAVFGSLRVIWLF